jgi:hypothetical protein
MELPLCFTIGELQHRLRFPRNALDVFQLINLYRPQNWKFSFYFDQHQKVDLDIEFGLAEDPSFMISSGALALLDCDRVEMVAAGQRWSCDWRRGLNYPPSENVLKLECRGATDGAPGFRLIGFGAEAFPPEFSHWESIKSFLRMNTWMGSYGIPREVFSVELSVFGNRTLFRNSSVAYDALAKDEASGIPTLTLAQSLGEPVVGEAYLLSSASQSESVFRWTHSGVVRRDDLKRTLGLDMRWWPTNGELEVRFPGHALGPDGTLAVDGSARAIVRALTELTPRVHANTRYVQYLRECEQFEKRISAQRIDRRKAELLHTQFIFCKGKLVYKAPTNEMEIVALHQKLEGMGALPFSEFVSLEYTPKLGIDAIVNFKVRSIEALHRFATVEFEYRLESFASHSHPVEQTDMIICWEKAAITSVGKWPYEGDAHLPWLGYLHVGGKLIVVAEASRYPGLERHAITFSG